LENALVTLYRCRLLLPSAEILLPGCKILCFLLFWYNTEVDTIDLRKKEDREVSQVSNSSSDEVLLDWTADEHDYSPPTLRWFYTIGAIALALILFGIFAQSYFFVAFVVLSAVLLLLYARRAPETLYFAVTRQGIGVGKSFYPYSELQNFRISDEYNDLVLETHRYLSSQVRIPLADTTSEDIRTMLRPYLSEIEGQERLSDHIARLLRL